MKKILFVLALFVSVSAEAQERPLLLTNAVYRSAKVVDTLPIVARYEPPAIYAEWMAEVASCLHLDPVPTAIMEQVRFFEVNAKEFRPSGRSYGLAATFASELQMYVVIGAIDRKDVITHEIVHLLLWANGLSDKDHPRDYFETCGVHTTLPREINR